MELSFLANFEGRLPLGSKIFHEEVSIWSGYLPIEILDEDSPQQMTPRPLRFQLIRRFLMNVTLK